MTQRRFKLKKGDNVKILSGNSVGKEGKILKVYPKDAKAVVQGVNIVKMHRRKTQTNPQGGIEAKESPVDMSNLMLICPKCGIPTRVAYHVVKEGGLSRVCKKCKEMIDT